VSSQAVRVLQIITRLNVSGPSMHVTLLAEKLGAPDFESTLVCGTLEPGEGDMAYFAEGHNVTPVVIPELGRALSPIRDIKTFWKVYKLIEQMKPDVVHTHTAKAGFIGRMAARMAGTPVIIHTFHGHIFEGFFSWPVNQVFILLERLAARSSDTIITLTDGLRRELAEEYHVARKGRMTVLPLGMDLDVFAKTPRKNGIFRAAWEIPADAPLIGIVGRLAPVKNHALFLQAAAQVKASLPAARFVIVGDGETRSQLDAQVEALGLKDSVTFTGWQRDLAPLYGDLDALVISSLNEGTPGSVIEALAACCPVVATAVGGLPDVLDHGVLGKLTPPGNADALAAAILDTILNPPDGVEPQRLMLDRYGIDRLVQDLKSLYRGLLTKKSAKFKVQNAK
jgi:glycosyltransferase involved in cell wall biosynthesis